MKGQEIPSLDKMVDSLTNREALFAKESLFDTFAKETKGGDHTDPAAGRSGTTDPDP